MEHPGKPIGGDETFPELNERGVIHTRQALEVPVGTARQLFVDQPAEQPDFVVAPSAHGWWLEKTSKNTTHRMVVEPLKPGLDWDMLDEHKGVCFWLDWLSFTLSILTRHLFVFSGVIHQTLW